MCIDNQLLGLISKCDDLLCCSGIDYHLLNDFYMISVNMFNLTRARCLLTVFMCRTSKILHFSREIMLYDFKENFVKIPLPDLLLYLPYPHLLPPFIRGGDMLSPAAYISPFNILRPRKSCRNFADIFKCISLNENESNLLKNSLEFVPKVWFNNIPALVQLMAWRWPGDKPLSEPIMVSLLMYMCVTRPQWDIKHVL